MNEDQRLKLIDRYWQASNYLAAGQIFLCDNPLLERPIEASDIKPRLLGHWGTSPGLNLVYVHLNRLILDSGANIIYVIGPGHGAPAILANCWLEKTYSEYFPNVTRNREGMERFFRQFSTPGGIPSHVSPHCPGSIHEGGELGYSLAHAFGAAFDNPDLIVACVVGDGEAETGPLEGSWKSIDFLNPARDGAVLPILHLNGYKISGPTVLGRTPEDDARAFFGSHEYEVFWVAGDDPMDVHRQMFEALDKAYARIREIQQNARENNDLTLPRWPAIVLKTPKGWTGPKEVDGKQVEGTFRAHQVPLPKAKTDETQRRQLEDWLKSYAPQELFDEQGHPDPAFDALIPEGEKRMGANPHANGGSRLIELDLPAYSDYALEVPAPGTVRAEATRRLGDFLRDVFRRNENTANFRLFCPDETNSNRLGAVFETTDRCSMLPTEDSDENIGPDGRVMEVLSEHLCEGWMEGYLLTGRHGLFPCYEAFVTIIDSMMNQHAKWLKTTLEIPWRHKISSFNYLLTSHAWRQDHNGYSHQGPGFIDAVINKKSAVTRIYLAPDANCLLAIMDHCLHSRNYINVVVAGKQPELQWLDVEAAREHCARGASAWDWAGNDGGEKPDIVFACAGDVPTVEAVAATWIVRKHLPELKVRLVNVVDLMSLSPPAYHPHGLDPGSFDELFTTDVPVMFAFHGYPRIVHDLVHGRPNPARFHVHGYIEEGTTTTPFDMVVMNHLSRFHLALGVLDYLPDLGDAGVRLRDFCEEQLEKHKLYIRDNLEDLPEITNWTWSDPNEGEAQ
ncbi:MAG: phosphoketolase family protein [Gammaproteobacteria bacterium]